MVLRNIRSHLSNYKFYNSKNHSLIPVSTSTHVDLFLGTYVYFSYHLLSENACIRCSLEMSTIKTTNYKKFKTLTKESTGSQ
jgi:hypothetical protein